MGKLILTSNGFIQNENSNNEIIKKYATNKNLLFIDNATSTGSNVDNIDIILNNFRKITKITNRCTLSKENYTSINDYDILYFTGGDLLPLIELAKEKDINMALLNFLKSNKTIIGESAGAIIFGEDLKYYYDIKRGTKPKYDIQLKNYNGFGFVNINIFPHWNKTNDIIKNKTALYENTHNIKITKLNDGDYVLINI